jgi:AcrR family transcriptional regulator
MASEVTKNKILDAALRLFNEQGTEQVTTNHIAVAAGISPGNLYYHYRNKEAIIRALVLDRLFPALNQLWAAGGEQPPSMAGLRALLRRHYEIFWGYRFFRDVLNLIRRDPLLGEQYRQIYAVRTQSVHKLIEHFVAAGVLQPLEPAVVNDLVTACWIVTTHWLAYLETVGEPITVQQMERGADLILRLLEPYTKTK